MAAPTEDVSGETGRKELVTALASSAAMTTDDLAKWWTACGGGAKRPKGTKAEMARALASLATQKSIGSFFAKKGAAKPRACWPAPARM